jgi:hypothetical protein
MLDTLIFDYLMLISYGLFSMIFVWCSSTLILLELYLALLTFTVEGESLFSFIIYWSFLSSSSFSLNSSSTILSKIIPPDIIPPFYSLSKSWLLLGRSLTEISWSSSISDDSSIIELFLDFILALALTFFLCSPGYSGTGKVLSSPKFGIL